MEVAAGAIAFAQAAESIVKYIVKAHQFWQQLKDIPEELEFLIEDLKLFETEFRDIEAELSHHNIPSKFWDDAAAKQSLNHAERARNILASLINELSDKLGNKKGLKQKIALAKISTKKDLIERFEKRLDRAVKHLTTSRQSYQIALQRQTADYIVTRITAELLPQFARPQLAQRHTIECHDYESETLKSRKETRHFPHSKTLPVANTYVPSKWGRYAMAYTSDTGAWQAYIQCPSWMSQKIYELQYSPTMCGWTHNFRAYNIVPRNADIIKRVRNGDKNGVLELFYSGKASPYDRDSRGYSLLYYAAQCENYQVCQLLLEQGPQDQLEQATYWKARNRPASPLSALLHGDDRQNLGEERKKLIDLFQSYLQDPDFLPNSRLFDYLNMEVWTYGDSHLFIFQERFLPKYYERSLQSRLEAVRLGAFHMNSVASLCKLLSKDQTIKKSDVGLSGSEKLSLVHSSALALGIRLADEILKPPPEHDKSWSDFVVQVASAATAEDLHSIELVSPWDVYQVPEWRGTPLVSAIGGSLCYLSPDIPVFHWDEVFQKTLQQWLEDVRLAGVDLFEYGKHEKSLLQRGAKAAFDADAIESSRNSIRETMGRGGTLCNSRLEHLSGMGQDINHWVPIRIIDLEIGPDPTDWHILWAPEFEYMASQFWTMIERETVRMPGSWVE
ncbi:Fc.00g019420.m01.CDS01 [Cosmosporella sp. VM-42]